MSSTSPPGLLAKELFEQILLDLVWVEVLSRENSLIMESMILKPEMHSVHSPTKEQLLQ